MGDFATALLALVLAALVVMGSPGPSTMSATAVGAALGLRRSLPYVTGLVLGTAAVLLAVATGVISALRAVPGLEPVLIAASVAYILWLAFRIATAPPLAAAGAEARAPSLAGGFLLGIANPKAWLAIAAVFAGSTLPIEPLLAGNLVKVAVLSGMIVAIHATWLIAGASLSRLLRDPVVSRTVNIAFAVILVVAALLPLVW